MTPEQRIAELEAEVERLKEQSVCDDRDANAEHDRAIQLQREASSLRQQVATLTAANARLVEELAGVREDNAALRAVAQWILESSEGWELVAESDDPRVDAVFCESGGDDIGVRADIKHAKEQP
jgi:predicted Zn-dependent protease